MAEGMSFMARSIIARFIYRRRVEEGQVEEGQVEEGQVEGGASGGGAGYTSQRVGRSPSAPAIMHYDTVRTVHATAPQYSSTTDTSALLDSIITGLTGL